MKVVPALVAVLLAWVVLICAAATTSSEINGGPKPKPPPRRPPPPPRQPDAVLDLKDVSKAKYSDFIATLRGKLQDPKQARFGIPMLRKLSESQYMYVKLISAEQNSIELAIDKRTIYLVGYSHKNGKELGARFFKDIDKKKYQDIFPNAKIRGKENIGYQGSYEKLQTNAGVGRDPKDRVKVKLGMKALGSFIDKISATHPSSIPKDEANLLLVAIQMISEAVRFKYIENQVKGKIPNDFNPDLKVPKLENSWDKLSAAIASVKSETEPFKTPVTLWDPKGNDWVVTTVKQIKPDMGLLNSVSASELPKWPLDDNVPVPAQSITSLLATI